MYEVNIHDTWVVHWLTDPVVSSSHPEARILAPDPEAEQCLQQVVDNDNVLDVEWFSVLHVVWSSNSDDVVI